MIEFYPKEQKAYYVEFYPDGRWKLYCNKSRSDEFNEAVCDYSILEGQIDKTDKKPIVDKAEAFIKYMVDALNEKHVRDTRNAWP